MSDKKEEVASALASITICTREDWLRIAYALEREFGDEGAELFHAFSAGGGYGKYDQKEADAVWRRAKGRGQVPLSFIFRRAYDAGWTPDRKYEKTTQAEKSARDAVRAEQMRRMEVLRDAGAQAAERAAAELLLPENSEPCESHPYLLAKGVQPVHGLRVCKRRLAYKLLSRDEWRSVTVARRGDLLVPIFVNKRLVSMQTIDGHGDKRYICGSKRLGGSFFIKGMQAGPIVGVEGLATGLTVREMSGLPVIVCFDTSGIAHTTNQLFDVVAADNDENGAGESAAKKSGKPYIMPPIQGMDWNDYAKHVGAESATRVFMDALVVASRENTAINQGE